MTRSLWVVVHRWLGLFMAAFLLIAGITGTALCFYPEIQLALNPKWQKVDPQHNYLDAKQIVAEVEKKYPNLSVSTVDFRGMDEVASVRVTPKMQHGNGQRQGQGQGQAQGQGHNHAKANLPFDRIILDPKTGAIVDTVKTNDIAKGGISRLGEFLLYLHFQLSLGKIGTLFMGIVAIVWLLDSFVNFYLTLPKLKPAQTGEDDVNHKNFWQRWAPSWKIRTKSGGYKLNFDLHRAFGLWLWAVLVIFAWSSFQFNFHMDLYPKLMKTISDYETTSDTLPKLKKPLMNPKIDWGQAQELGNSYAKSELEKIGVEPIAPVRIFYNPRNGAYYYQTTTTKDLEDRPRHHGTMVYIDGNSGKMLRFSRPTGEHWGNTLSSWTASLHSGVVFGWAYRIFVSLLGLVVAGLSLTGFIIWIKKRGARQTAKIRIKQKLLPAAAE